MQLKGLGKQLEMVDIPMPKVKRGEVRLKINTCGLNFADILMVEGKYQEKNKIPFSPGMEVCGEVEKVGENVSSLKESDRVIAFIGYGGLSEFVCVEQSKCFKITDEISDEQAACLFVAYGSTELALNYKANLQAKETLLVLGAGGGVGLSAVELGRIMGATVIASARGDKKCMVARDRGANFVINNEVQELRDELQKFNGIDVIYDPVGGDKLRSCLSFVNPEARVLPIGFASGQVPNIPLNVVMVKNISIIGFYIGLYRNYKTHVLTECFLRLIHLCTQKKITPHISHVFSLKQANEALNTVKLRKSTGNVVVKMNS